MTPFLQLVFALMVIITAAKAGGWLAVRLRQPAVLGELLVGVLLGPEPARPTALAVPGQYS